MSVTPRPRLRTKGRRRIATCTQCGVKEECDALSNPGYWVELTLNPPVLCCSQECLDLWKDEHRNVIETAAQDYTRQFEGGSRVR